MAVSRVHYFNVIQKRNFHLRNRLERAIILKSAKATVDLDAVTSIFKGGAYGHAEQYLIVITISGQFGLYVTGIIWEVVWLNCGNLSGCGGNLMRQFSHDASHQIRSHRPNSLCDKIIQWNEGSGWPQRPSSHRKYSHGLTQIGHGVSWQVLFWDENYWINDPFDENETSDQQWWSQLPEPGRAQRCPRAQGANRSKGVWGVFP